MRQAHRGLSGQSVLAFTMIAVLSGFAVGCGEQQTATSPAADTTVKANESNAAAWAKVKDERKTASPKK